MALPTILDIDTAVPVGGTPSRALVNLLLKNAVADVATRALASDIVAPVAVVNDLTTGGAEAALSAAQGVALKTLADAKLSKLAIVENVDGTSYSFTDADIGKIKRFRNPAGCAADIDIGREQGFNCVWVQAVGAGAITFGGTAGVSSLGGQLISGGENASGSIIPNDEAGPDQYLVVGALGVLTASVVSDFGPSVLAVVGSGLVSVMTAGTPTEGQVLTFSLPAGLTGTFQVTRNGTDVPTTGLSSAGVNSFAYTLVTADAGTSVNVRVSAVRYLGSALTIAGTSSAVAISTLTDNFNDNSRDVAKWAIGYFRGVASDQAVAEVNAQLEIPVKVSTAGVTVSGFVSVNSYDVTAGNAYVRYVEASSTSSLHDMYFALYSSANNAVFWRMRGSTLAAFTLNEGVEAAVAAVIGYSATSHAWLRIREAAGTIFFDTASSTAANPPSTGDWVNRFSVAKPAGLILTAVKVALNGGSNGSTGTPGVTKFDGFNGAT